MPSKDTPPNAVGETVETAMSTILRWSTRGDNRRMLQDSGGVPLSTTDSWLLERIAATGPVRMSQLADWLSVDKSTMTTEVRRLEHAGLISRAADASDRRAVLVTATTAGREAIALHRATAQQVYSTLVGKWSEDDRTAFAQLLGRFVAELSWVTDAVAEHNQAR
jgi:DNA-binding MarR family transcriptional regulator